jgi:hypothetical protein
MKLTGRQLTTIVVAVCGAAVFTPVAVYASTGSLVNITDPVSSSQKARVIGGKLAVGDGSGALTVDGGTVALEPATAWSAFKRVTNDGNDELVVRSLAANAGVSLGSMTMSRVTGTQPILVQLRTIVPTTAGNCAGGGTVQRELGQFALPANDTRTVTWAPRLKVPRSSVVTCLVATTLGGTNGDLTTIELTGATY